ncbi:MAG: Crp/Fnr family transcriptional regulator, partial [Clostridia bacterium]|nr:Crp/Fnr family transcriptional regulator [Clostridia bacterium]
MKKYLEILRKCPLFYSIEDSHLLKMLSCLGARVQFFDKKYTIIAEGTPAKYIGIVLSGSVHILQVDYYGNRSILSSIGASHVFAEAFACAEAESVPVTVVANEPCEVMLIDNAHILHTCENNCGFHRQLIFNLMKDLAKKTILFHQKIEITSKRTTREKLMAYLMFCAKNAGS